MKLSRKLLMVSAAALLSISPVVAASIPSSNVQAAASKNATTTVLLKRNAYIYNSKGKTNKKVIKKGRSINVNQLKAIGTKLFYRINNRKQYVKAANVGKLTGRKLKLVNKLPGDEGLFNVPKDMQGTWYYIDSYTKKPEKLVIGQNVINNKGYKPELHVMNKHFGDKTNLTKWSRAYRDASRDWSDTSLTKVRGINYVQVIKWGAVGGDGLSYGLHKEAGQPVIVIGTGAKTWTENVAWKTPELAKENSGKHFKDLDY